VSELPEGVPVFHRKPCPYGVKDCLECQQIPPIHLIGAENFIFDGWQNRLDLIHAEYIERYKAIARAAFVQARQRQWQVDDYLNSEQFKKLVGEK